MPKASWMFRYIVALNNVAVDLFAQNCYHQGLDTLREAKLLMKRTLDGDHPTREEANDALQAAQDRLHSAEPLERPSVLPLRKRHYSPGFTELECPRQGGSVTLIRLSLGSEEDFDEECVSASVLFNTGVGYLCLAELTKQDDDHLQGSVSESYQVAAFRLFQISLSMFLRIISSDDPDSNFRPDTVHLAVDVLTALIPVWRATVGDESSTGQLVGILQNLECIVDEMEAVSRLLKECVATAPAAAA